MLTRSLPIDISTAIVQELNLLKSFFSYQSEREFVPSTVYWPGFLVSLIGNSIQSLIESMFEYSLDLSIFTILCTSSLKPYLFQNIHENLVQDSVKIAQILFAMTKTLKTPLKTFPNKNTCLIKHLEGYSFPVCIAPVYLMNKSDVLFGDKFYFSLAELNS